MLGLALEALLLDELLAALAPPEEELAAADDPAEVDPLLPAADVTEALEDNTAEVPEPGTPGPASWSPPNPPRLPLHARLAATLATLTRRAHFRIGEVFTRLLLFTRPVCVRRAEEEGTKIAAHLAVSVLAERFACPCITPAS